MRGSGPSPYASSRIRAAADPEPPGDSMPVHAPPRRIRIASPGRNDRADTAPVVRQAVAGESPSAESFPALQSTYQDLPPAPAVVAAASMALNTLTASASRV